MEKNKLIKDVNRIVQTYIKMSPYVYTTFWKLMEKTFSVNYVYKNNLNDKDVLEMWNYFEKEVKNRKIDISILLPPDTEPNYCAPYDWVIFNHNKYKAKKIKYRYSYGCWGPSEMLESITIDSFEIYDNKIRYVSKGRPISNNPKVYKTTFEIKMDEKDTEEFLLICKMFKQFSQQEDLPKPCDMVPDELLITYENGQSIKFIDVDTNDLAVKRLLELAKRNEPSL